ncbi:MAG: hypothetical protein JWL66_1663 [Sphingomonadales bacterium]|nr:hypothetical protein [Sphingomonadales bacterium]
MTPYELSAAIDGLAAMNSVQLRKAWHRVYGTVPNKGLGPSLMRRGIAYRLQEQAYGGVSAATLRTLVRLAEQLNKSGDLDVERQLSLKTGTRLVREWHGRTCHVTVLENSFLYEDQQYASLSQIARVVTGTKWSGPRFFGLRQRSDPAARVSARG